MEERRRFLAAFEDEGLFRAYLARIRTPPKLVPHPSGGMKRVGGGRVPDGKAAKEIFRRTQHYRLPGVNYIGSMCNCRAAPVRPRR